MQVTRHEKEHAVVVLSGTLAKTAVAGFYEQALTAVAEAVSVPGFRRGHVPRERVIEEVGEEFLWRDAAERLLRGEIDAVLKKEALVPITPLSLTLSPKGPGGDVDFEIIVVTPPSCEIVEYKAVAEKALSALTEEDTQKETEAAVRAFRTQVRAIRAVQAGEEVEEGAAKEVADKAGVVITDEEATAVGFENGTAAEFFIKGEAEKAVHDRVVQKRRAAVADALITAATCKIPTVLVEEESRTLLEMFKRDIAGQNLVWSDYLKRVGKSEEEVRADLLPNAKKRIVLDLVFGHIAEEEKLELSEEDKKKEEEFAHRLAEHQGVPHDRAHAYARESFMREKVWELLGVRASA